MRNERATEKLFDSRRRSGYVDLVKCMLNNRLALENALLLRRAAVGF